MYCEQGGIITVTAWPKPDLASGSTGTFKIYDAATNTLLLGLNDFQTGTAQIDPLVANAVVAGHTPYADIRIEYTYNDGNDSFNNGTAYTSSTKASQIFRIVPNPTALFTRASNLPNAYVASGGSYCVGQPITFNPSGSTPGGGGGSAIYAYSWTFDDPSNSIVVNGVVTNPNSDLVAGPAGQPAIPG